jgi:hypothetical protein
MWKHRLKVETAYVKLDPIATVSIGEPLVVTGKSNRQEGLVIFVTCKGPVELPPDLVRIENGAFWCIFDTTGATTGKYIVEADDCEGHTDTATVEILVPSPHAPEASVSSLLHCDITGDSINDILVYVYTIDPVTDMPTKRSHINAIDGSNGETLWNKSFEDCLAVTLSAGDLNGDNKTDLVINLVCTDLISMEASGKVVGVNGCNGVELWSKSKTGDRNEGVAMVGFPANLTSTNRTDVVVSTITFSRYGSRTNITAINGSDGTELWEKSFTDSQVYGVPVDLTNDGKDEVVIGMPQEIGTPLAMMSTMTPNVIAQ